MKYGDDDKKIFHANFPNIFDNFTPIEITF